jgi:hypothetical protein
VDETETLNGASHFLSDDFDAMNTEAEERGSTDEHDQVLAAATPTYERFREQVVLVDTDESDVGDEAGGKLMSMIFFNRRQRG